MRPFIIGIGGGHSGSGKTAVACAILEKLEGWGAIKYTKTSLFSAIVDDREVLSEQGKDTKRLLDSGAEKVLWVRSPVNELGEILPMAVEMLSYLNGIVVEGNSAVKVLTPDIVIFSSGTEGKIKQGADEVLRMSDVVIFDKKLPPLTPKDAVRFSRDAMGRCIDFIRKCIKENRRKKDSGEA